MGKHLLLFSLFLTSFNAIHVSAQAPPPPTPACSLQVVVHVLHQNGPENISDSQVVDAIRILNEDFSKTNADTADIIPQFKSIADDSRIRFALATVDPQGNATNGIDRIFTTRTNVDDSSKLNQWPPNKYVNIWVVRGAANAGTAGYAYLPKSINTFGEQVDGLIVLHDYTGSIGTSSQVNSRVLTNLAGHYLGLLNPWGENNNAGATCGDDSIIDTPPTKGWLNCPSDPAQAKVCHPAGATGPNDTGIVENYQNFMEYSFCSNMFTADQCQAMRDVLNSTLANRNQLCDATGVGINDLPLTNNEFSLYPNPATSTVQLSYQLTKESKVRIELLDALARSVHTIADDKQAIGSHTLSTNVGNLPAGIYIVKLTADNIALSKRLVVTK